MLSLHDVHSYYGDSHILQGVSLTMGRNQCVAILGRNGAGKTTTLRTIVGLTRAWRGRITFNGRDIGREPTFRIVRSGTAYVADDRGICPSWSVEVSLGIAGRE